MKVSGNQSTMGVKVGPQGKWKASWGHIVIRSLLMAHVCLPIGRIFAKVCRGRAKVRIVFQSSEVDSFQ